MSKFDFNDILIKPSVGSSINSRKEVNPFYNGFLPLITAPMDTVIDNSNESIYRDLKINTCTPRGMVNENGFTSISLTDIETDLKNSVIKKYTLVKNGHYLIDIANGHMNKLCVLVKRIKKKYPKLTLMVGNVASPETYVELSNAGADYVRVGIGNGGGCFLENSMVTTSEGDKVIQDVVIGDEVLTHTGEFKEVTSTLTYPTKETLIKINETTSTTNHEYYVLNKEYQEIVNDDNIQKYAEWLSADKITDEYFLLEMV